MAAYAVIADVLERYDARQAAVLLSDTGTALTPVELAASTVLATLILDASGTVETALLQGNRYKPAQLETLTGNSLAYLKRLVCELTILYLIRRRPQGEWDSKPYDWVNAELKKLQDGVNLFNLEDLSAANASLPMLSTPSLVAVETNGLIRNRTKHFFPNIDLPALRGGQRTT